MKRRFSASSSAIASASASAHSRSTARRLWRAAAGACAAVVLMTLAACGLSVPTDPDGTLKSVRGQTLTVGVTPHGDFVRVSGAAGADGALADDQVSGTEIRLVGDFAEHLGADVEYVLTSEEGLVRRLDAGEIDLAVGGFTKQSPWSSQAGATRPYTEAILSDGQRHPLIMLAPLGENAFISELERYLDAAAPVSAAPSGGAS